MITRVLIAFDGSESASKAFDQALEIATKFQASLLILTVARPPEPAGDVELEAVLENAQAHFAAVHADLKARADLRLPEVQSEIRVGHPAEQIVSVAEAERADLVVIGHRGKSLFQRWITGSVSKQVVSYAPCPVLVVR